MRPIAAGDEDYAKAYLVALSGHEGELFLEDLERTYLYKQEPAFLEVMEDCPAGVEPTVWLDGAQSVVRRLKRISLNPEVLTSDQAT